MSDEEMQQEINKEIYNWRASESLDPLIIDFEDGDKYIFCKDKKTA